MKKKFYGTQQHERKLGLYKETIGLMNAASNHDSLL